MTKIEKAEELINILLQKYKNMEDQNFCENISNSNGNDNGDISNDNYNLNAGSDEFEVLGCNRKDHGCDPLTIPDFQEMWDN